MHRLLSSLNTNLICGLNVVDAVYPISIDIIASLQFKCSIASGMKKTEVVWRNKVDAEVKYIVCLGCGGVNRDLITSVFVLAASYKLLNYSALEMVVNHSNSPTNIRSMMSSCILPFTNQREAKLRGWALPLPWYVSLCTTWWALPS